MKLLLLFLTVAGYIHPTTMKELSAEKILLIKVDESGTISVGRDTLISDNLARYIQERLFKSYVGTGKMHTRIKLEQISTTIPTEVIQVVIQEIQEGQKKTLTDLCLDKYKKLYENIDKKNKDKIQKQFPVLFQKYYQ